MHSRSLLVNTALEYRLNVMLLPRGELLPRGFTHGPMHRAGINWRTNTLAIEEPALPEDILHEMCHLIVGKPSIHLPEAFLLMPFEWELAKYLARKITGYRDRERFMSGVRSYQGGTVAGNLMLVEEYGPRVRATKWWRNGIERAKQLKLLYTDRRPTFFRAEWMASGVPYSMRGWSPEDET